MRKRLKKTRFRICLFLGIVIVILLLFSTNFYNRLPDIEDRPDLVSDVLKARLWGPAHYWLFVRWSWQPTDAAIVNVAAGLIHAILIAIIVPVVVFLIWFLTCFAYMAPLFIGGLLGIVAAALTNALSILLSKVGAGFDQVSYETFYIKGGFIGVYSAHALLIGFSLYFIMPLLRKLVFGVAKLIKLVFKPVLVGVALTYDGLRNRKAVSGRMRGQKGDIVLRKTQVLIPQVFDEKAIDTGLLQYRSDKRLLTTFLAGLAERYKDEAQIKVIRKKLERMNLGKEYLEAVYKAQEAYSNVARFDVREDLKTKEFELKRRKLDAELRKTGLVEEVEKKELELKLAKLAAEEAELKKAKKEPAEEEEEQKLVEKAQRKIANTIAMEAAQIEGIFKRAAFLAEQEEKIKEKYPSEVAERIIDLVDRMLREEETG